MMLNLSLKFRNADPGAKLKGYTVGVHTWYISLKNTRLEFITAPGFKKWRHRGLLSGSRAVQVP